MALGGGSPSVPTPAPVTPVPQQDDPQSLEHKRVAALGAKNREGDSAHLLAPDDNPRRQPGASTIF